MARWLTPLLATWYLLAYYAVPPVRGSDSLPLSEWLAQPILRPDQFQVELERYLEARIPRMPAVSTVAEWEAQAARIREDMLSRVVLRGTAREWSTGPLRIDWQEVIHGGDDYRIKKLRYEAVPGLWIPALLYEPIKVPGPLPVALNVNGHDGTGKAADYKQIRCVNQAKRGMLALNVEWLGMGQLRGPGYGHTRMNQLDLCGTSGLAPFYLAMQRGLDVLLSHPHADPSRVAVAGLSGGGWQTILISSLDQRVTLANPVAGYSSFLTRIRHYSDLGDPEQTPCDMATVADYTHLTALLAPRAALLTYNAKDNCCFASAHALPPLLEAAEPVYQLYGKPARLHSHINHDPGTHNFERENREALYGTLSRYFSVGPVRSGEPGSVTGDPTAEIDVRSEVKSENELRVSLPESNADFHSLALELAIPLPRDAALPADAARVEEWQRQKRELLRDLLRLRDLPLVAETVGERREAEVEVVRYRLRLADTWSVPLIEISPTEVRGTRLMFAEAGKQSLAEQVRACLRDNRRCVAVDPFYLGESAPKSRAYLWALLVQAVGDRPAGLQASQLIAVARWLKQRRPQEPIELETHGPRLALSALAAAACDPQAIDALQLNGSFASLHDVIDNNLGFDSHPELFPFGLLEHLDLATIVALCAPREVRFVSAGDRHRAALAELPAWYERLGRKFDPAEQE